MITFFFKKSFYDGWDNLLPLAAFNGVFLTLAAMGIWFPATLESTLARIAGLLFLVMAGSVWWSVAAHALTAVADFGTIRSGDLRKAFSAGLVPGLQFGAIMAVITTLASVVFPFYASIGNFFGLFATSLAFWLFLCMILILQYVLPWRATNGGSLRAALRSSLMLFMDAPLFSLVLALDGILCIAVSPLVAFLLPGPAAAVLASCEAVRLRSYKLRWIHQTGSRRKRAPWAELLATDVEALGERSFKQLFFPWSR
ncbi:MAG: hypothetical protein A2Y38_17625 [Spirochaetes bacterium GWB1_59_5]|nr:MAG: hypothetical protein A2Y38_17625 [Spirochaetes bacterium GWB1_59_5]